MTRFRRRRAPAPPPPHVAAVAQCAFDHAVVRIYDLPTEAARDRALHELAWALAQLGGENGREMDAHLEAAYVAAVA